MDFQFSTIVAGLAMALVAAAPPTTVRPAAQTALVRQMAEAGLARTVGVTCRVDKQANFFGTGAVLTPDGYIITSTTVVPTGAEEIEVFLNGPRTLKARIVESDQELEATLLKVDAQGLACFPVAREMPAVGNVRLPSATPMK